MHSALHSDVQHFAQRGDTVLIGDFNSRVGRADTSGQHVGQYGEVELDAPGRALRTLLETNNLFCLNDRMLSNQQEQPRVPAYTRIRQVNTTAGIVDQCAVLDYFLVPPPWTQTAACSLHVEPSWKPQGADHMLMWATLPHEAPHTHQPLHACAKPNVHLLTTPMRSYASATHVRFAT